MIHKSRASSHVVILIITTSSDCNTSVRPPLRDTTNIVTHPKVEPSGNVKSGREFPSAVFKKTLLPHHDWMVFSPIVPFWGYWRQKKIKMMDTAKPESRAAERTSDKRSVSKKGNTIPGGPLTIVLRPPREMSTPDNILENESNNCPWDVVQRTGWGNGPHTTEDNGEAALVWPGEKYSLADKRRHT